MINRIYVGNLDPRVMARELEDEFHVFGFLRRSVLPLRVSIPFHLFPALCVCVHLYVRG
jgi:hypothetical protein